MARELILHLKLPKDLFVFNPATYDPFDLDALGEAGVDYLFNQARMRWGTVPNLSVTICLPQAEMTPGIEATMSTALRSYWDGQLAASRHRHVAFLVDNAVYLLLAICIVVGGLWLQPRLAASTLIGNAEVKAALGTGIAVLTWVALWTPLSGFVLEWVPFARDRRAYRALLRTDVRVCAEPCRCKDRV